MAKRRVITLAVLFLMLAATLPSMVGHTSAAPLRAVGDFNILLGRPTDHSVTLNIIPDQSGEISFEYGVETGVYTDETSVVSCTNGTPIEEVIDGLDSNTRYYYRVRFRATSGDPWTAGAEHSFHTQRPAGSTFTFTIISDSHLGQYGGQTQDEKDLYTTALQNAEADNPDFHIDLGDTFAMDPSPLGTGMTDAEAKAAYYVQRPFLGPFADSIPIYLVIGNHENEEGWNFDDTFSAPDQSLARVGMKYRKLYYPNPIPDDFYTGNVDPLSEPIGGDTNHEDYYAWEWGDALFIVLDPYHYSMIWPAEGNTYGGEGTDGEAQGDRWDWTLGIQQYLWLKSTLEDSDAKFKFVFSHHVTGGNSPYGRGGIKAAPYFEWGGKNADGNWGFDTERPVAEGWDLPIHQLMVANGVSIFFHGHDHMYAYETLDGIVYLECPKPDDAGYTWQPYSYGYIESHYPDALQIQNSGHIRVTVSPSEVDAAYVRAYLPGDGTNGQIAHSFTVATPHELTMAVEPAGAGTTSPAVGAHSYAENASVQVAATAAHGYMFDHWSPNVVDPSQSTTSAVMDTDQTVTAYFVEAPTILGGVNNDAAVNSTDALLILSCDAGLATSAYCPMNCGDVNTDGAINSTDALIVLSYDVGMTVPYILGGAGCPSSVAPCAGCVP